LLWRVTMNVYYQELEATTLQHNIKIGLMLSVPSHVQTKFLLASNTKRKWIEVNEVKKAPLWIPKMFVFKVWVVLCSKGYQSLHTKNKIDTCAEIPYFKKWNLNTRRNYFLNRNIRFYRRGADTVPTLTKWQLMKN
jgi:hypothetical protein